MQFARVYDAIFGIVMQFSGLLCNFIGSVLKFVYVWLLTKNERHIGNVFLIKNKFLLVIFYIHQITSLKTENKD